MRRILNQQMPISQPFVGHPHGEELSVMSELLDALPDDILDAVHEDLVRETSAHVGRPALTAEQVLRALVIKQLNGFSYSELAFHLMDSTCYRAFCRFGAIDPVPSRSALQANIKRLRPATLEKLNQAIAVYAASTKIESGAKVRVDCTNVETHIHPPSDSTQLWDVVRVVTRIMVRVADRVDVPFVDHRLRANRRMHDIRNAKRQAQRVPLYRDLVKVTECTLSAGKKVATALEEQAQTSSHDRPVLGKYARKLRRFIELGDGVVSQARRRVFEDESVPASEKVLSIFEPHTDLIVKGRNGPGYGHKICLSTGASGLVLDCMILDGNPADVTLSTEMARRHRKQYQQAPKQMAFDGAFASRDNLQAIKNEGVIDVVFSKRCGLPLTAMARSSWIYKRLRDFRAGIEGCISFLKRCFGMTRCGWSGLDSFKAYVWGSIVSANLLVLARHQIAKQPM